MRACAFAIPGDPRQKTGGYIYEARLLDELRAAGRDVRQIELPDAAAAAEPGETVRAEVAEILEALPADLPLILDGLAFAAMRTTDLARLRCPVVAMLHHPMGMEEGLDPDIADRLIAQETANLSHAAHVVVTSPHTRETYIGLGADPARITVALPGLDLSEPAPCRTGRPLILSVGLLAPRKGHDILIRALGEIAALDWHARIIGKTYDAALAKDLAGLIERLGLSGRVVLDGELSDEDLARAYQDATIFALATRYEGYGMALVEAMAHGLPIVTCPTGAVVDTVRDGAILVPADDPEGFAGALRDLLLSPGKRADLARHSLDRVRELPRWTDTASVMGAVLDAIAG
ncbi:glycosyltransferase [Rhodobacterales bacterium HKCCE2091]|nr:glycosyltransferase [Rhodobacterales bacterium HKCCE2091]